MPVDTLSCNLVDYIRMCMLLKCNIRLTCNICSITIFLLAATTKLHKNQKQKTGKIKSQIHNQPNKYMYSSYVV